MPKHSTTFDNSSSLPSTTFFRPLHSPLILAAPPYPMDPKLAIVMLITLSFMGMVRAGDPDPLQDICVADLKNKVKVNGFVCKDAANAKAEDFVQRGLNIAGNTNNFLGSNVTAANVMTLPGLNTLGISMVRIDFAAPLGLNPPHTHPRATEMLFLMKGTLHVGFVTTDDKLFEQVLYEGDVFVFPKALVHFQLNVGKEAAVAIAALSSQLPGTQQIAKSLFGASPPIDVAALSKGFQLDHRIVKILQERNWNS